MHNHPTYTLTGMLFIAVVAMMMGCETTDSGSMPSTQNTPPSQNPTMRTPPMTTAAPAQEPSSSMHTTTTGPSSRLAPAAGTDDDTLQACMARIPQDATPSQRMLAGRTCQRDEEVRRPFSGIPGR